MLDTQTNQWIQEIKAVLKAVLYERRLLRDRQKYREAQASKGLLVRQSEKYWVSKECRELNFEMCRTKTCVCACHL